MSETADPTPVSADPTPAEPTLTDPTPAPADPASATPEPPPPADTAQTAANLRELYNLTAGTDDTGDSPADGQQPQEQQEQPYTVEYPEGFPVDDTFASIVTPIAKDSGLDGKTFGGLTAKVLQAVNDAEYANMVKTDAELKKDWGSEYDTNMRLARSTAQKLMRQSGLTEPDLAVLQCPKGMRLLYAISQMTGEKPAAGTTPPSAAESSWAKDVMSNPNHPDYKDFRDPSSPRWRELNIRYNRATGAMA